MIPGWSSTKVVQIVPVGCISRSRGQKIGFQNAIFKNLLVWNYNAQSFHIWYIASSRSPLPIFGYNNIMASPWPLTFSSGERPRALWTLLLTLYITTPHNSCSNTLFVIGDRPTFPPDVGIKDAVNPEDVEMKTALSKWKTFEYYGIWL